MYRHVWTWYKSESDDRLAGRGLKCFSLEMCSNSDVREFHARMKMRSMSLRFFDRLQSSSGALRNSISANSVHVTMEIYISSLRSFVSHYKATRFGRVHVLISQNKTSPLPICTHTVISSLEHCTESQWRYSTVRVCKRECEQGTKCSLEGNASKFLGKRMAVGWP